MIADVRYDGRQTTAAVIASPTSNAASVARWIVGHGIARCRPDDHFDEDVGAHIAVSRAIADWARQYEEVALTLPKSEVQATFERAFQGIQDLFTGGPRDTKIQVIREVDGRTLERFVTKREAQLIAEITRFTGNSVDDPEGLGS